MKKRRSPIVVAAVALAVAAFFFAQSAATDPGQVTAAGSARSFQEYTPEAVSLATADETVVLFFHAVWCSTCKLLADDITANVDRIPDDLQILLVDFDTATDLKQRYGVTLQHTLVQLDSNGDAVEQWHLIRTLDDLLDSLV
ncbi:thioredoxin domain-containing protein [Arthrobacter sp. Br18]|uniref:thioredoxin domain-containing protein n=1 Tax=Arthrobacter sp. Br18 TaxID=1312954 RepID=UPI0004B0F922|nr:thioredoxin domain-containing protein [Arthrobacter sp. Br18]